MSTSLSVSCPISAAAVSVCAALRADRCDLAVLRVEARQQHSWLQQRAQGGDTTVDLRQVGTVGTVELWRADADKMHIAESGRLRVGRGEGQPA